MDKVDTAVFDSNLQAAFRDASQEGDFQHVGQGYEEISTGRLLASHGFAQCHGLLLINARDGVTLLKHVGPRPIEVVFGGMGQGKSFQRQYGLFMAHAARHGRKIVVSQTFGDKSYPDSELVDELKKHAAKNNITVDVVPSTKVPSGQWKWAMVYDPQKGHAITRHYTEDSDTPIYTTHPVPGVDPTQFRQKSRREMEHALMLLQKKGDDKRSIRQALSVSSCEELEQALSAMQKENGVKYIHALLQAPLWDDEPTTAVDLMKRELRRQCDGKSKISTDDTLRCIKILADFDAQDDHTKGHYAIALINIFWETDCNVTVGKKAFAYAETIISRMGNENIAREVREHLQKSQQVLLRSEARQSWPQRRP